MVRKIENPSLKDRRSSKQARILIPDTSNIGIVRNAHRRSYSPNIAILTDATDKPENLMTPIEKMDVVR